MDRKKLLSTVFTTEAARIAFNEAFYLCQEDQTQPLDQENIDVRLTIDGHEYPLPIFNDDGSTNDYNDTMWGLLSNFIECASEYYDALYEYTADNK
jgi:hypothetical protein